MRPLIPRALRLILPGCVALAVAGCATPAFQDPVRSGPFFTPVNHVGEPSLGGIRRVVLLPILGGTIASVENAAELDDIFLAALQREHRFEVVTFSRQQMLRRFHAEALSAAGTLPPDLLPMLQREHGADAVMFVDLTAYSAYRPLLLGLRAKLTTIDGTRLLWTFDDSFAASNPAVANSARHHFLGDGGQLPADLTPSVLQSPGRFGTYAASAMFATLPPVTPVMPAKERRASGAR
jgi:hypothetical protein